MSGMMLVTFRNYFSNFGKTVTKKNVKGFQTFLKLQNNVHCSKLTEVHRCRCSLGKCRQLFPTNKSNLLLSNMHGKYFSSGIKQTTVPACSKNNNENSYLQCSDKNTFGVLSKDMKVIKDFISEEEEQQILTEIEPYLKRLRYETAHWDDAIHGFRETEKSKWTEKNNDIIQRVRDVAFPHGVKQISYVHVLDLKKDGFIKPHVDAVKFCGSTISGISLLSSSVMRLVNSEDKSKFADVLLERRSLYIMKDEARYKYSHEILKEEESIFKGKAVPKDRRISVICRNQP